jgi:hypothetical protein
MFYKLIHGVKLNGRRMTKRLLMKLISNPACPADPTAVRGRVISGIGFLLAVALFSTGCHKAAEAVDTTVAPPPPQAPVVTAAPDPTPNQDTQGGVVNPNPQQASAPAQVDGDGRPYAKANGEPDLHVMDRALLDWRFSHQRKPVSFAEFAASAGFVIPPPPPGKTYSLAANGHIILIDR